jgi:hypothetical protein
MLGFPLDPHGIAFGAACSIIPRRQDRRRQLGD